MSIRNMFLDKEDNLELASVLTAIGFVAFIGIAVYSYVVAGQQFDPMGFGTGAGGLAAGGGAGKLLGNKGDYA